MDRRFYDTIFGLVTSAAAKGLTIFIVVSTIFTGPKLETLLLAVPAVTLFACSKLFEQNSNLINTNKLEKIRNRYIKSVKQLLLTKEITPEFYSSMDRYSNLLKKQREFDYIKIQLMLKQMEEGQFQDFKVDYEYLQRDGYKTDLQTKTVTCHYKSLDCFLQDQTKKIDEFKVKSFVGEFELKINYQLTSNNKISTASHTHINYFSLIDMNNMLKEIYPERFETTYEYTNADDQNNQPSDEQTKETKQNHQTNKNNDDEMTK